MTITDALLAEIKNYLNITWDDAEMDLKIKGIAQRGMARIDRWAGRAMDYTEEGSVKALLFDYVRYGMAEALEEFTQNYQEEIIELQSDERAKQSVEQQTATPTE